jgi:acyl-CoA thioester hydrolase
VTCNVRTGKSAIRTADLPVRTKDQHPAMNFPYDLPDLNLEAPLDLHRDVVRPEWIDLNGHMNVGFYVVAFDKATDTFFEQLGVAWAYVEHKLGLTFVLEAHVTYDREVLLNMPLRITTQILDHDEKRVHFFHSMFHAEEGWLASTNELVAMHIGYETRRSAPWLPETKRRLDLLAAAHKELPWPNKAGRLISLRKKA